MIEIKDLLNRFDHLLLSQEFQKEFIRKTISEAIKSEIKKEDIQIKNNSIFLNIKPIYKNEIFIKKDFIFLELKKFFKEKTPSSVR
jgi:hypothetical protein